jgi:hypothetical protein
VDKKDLAAACVTCTLVFEIALAPGREEVGTLAHNEPPDYAPRPIPEVACAVSSSASPELFRPLSRLLMMSSTLPFGTIKKP